MSAKHRVARPTREALLEAAAELFARRGYDGTTIEAIATRAGANKAMVSYHYGGKRKLYTALLSEILGNASVRLDAVREWEAPPDQRMAAFIAAFRELVRSRPSAPQLMLREAISGGRHMDRRVLPAFLRIFTVLQDILEQGTREGKFRAVNPVLTQVGLIGSLMFFFATETFRRRVVRELHIDAGPMEAEDYIRHWREMMLGGLAARPAGIETGGVENGPQSGGTR